MVQSILRGVRLSVDKHASFCLALVGHYDCAGNPAKEDEQLQHLIDGVAFLRLHYREIPVIGLWVDANWKVKEVVNSEQSAAADAASRRG